MDEQHKKSRIGIEKKEGRSEKKKNINKQIIKVSIYMVMISAHFTFCGCEYFRRGILSSFIQFI